MRVTEAEFKRLLKRLDHIGHKRFTREDGEECCACGRLWPCPFATEVLTQADQRKRIPLKQRQKQPGLKLLESDTTTQCVSMLRSHGWELIRLHSGRAKHIHGDAYLYLGPKGRPDWWVMRPIKTTPGLHHGFYLEMKRPGEEARFEQEQRMLLLRKQGYLAFVADGVEPLISWMRSNGLPA